MEWLKTQVRVTTSAQVLAFEMLLLKRMVPFFRGALPVLSLCLAITSATSFFIYDITFSSKFKAMIMTFIS